MLTVLVQKNRACVARTVVSCVAKFFCIMCVRRCMRHCRADWIAEGFSSCYKYGYKRRVIDSRFWLFAGLMFRISPFRDHRFLTTIFSNFLACFFLLLINQLDAQNLFYNKFISCLYMFRAPCADRQEVKIVLYINVNRHSTFLISLITG
jgi:hypothetical protein